MYVLDIDIDEIDMDEDESIFTFCAQPLQQDCKDV